MPAILNVGRNLIAQKQAAGQVLVIDRFVLANINGLNPDQAVSLDEAMPVPGDIVFTGAVTDSGYVNPDQVVYSLLLGSGVGDFDFNWVGLLADDGTLVAVNYSPLQQKRKTVGVTLGNAITRNFLIAFTDAQALTNISISSETWQIDFTARFDAQDERARETDKDFYGDQTFLDAGFQIVNDAAIFKMQAGVGYVEGVRVENAAELVVVPGVLPKDVWLDVSLQASATNVSDTVDVVFSSAVQNNYVDANGRQHYFVKIASIDVAGVVTDNRNNQPVGASVLQYVLDAMPDKASAAKVIAGTDDVDFVTAKAGGDRYYHPDNKPTADDVGAIANTLSVALLGDITLNNGRHIKVKDVGGVVRNILTVDATDKTVVGNFGMTTKIIGSGFEYHDGVEARTIYHSGNLPPTDIPTGTIMAFGGQIAPNGFLFCYGLLLNRGVYVGLFSVVDEVFGVGDGVTTYLGPDFRAEFVRGADSGRGIDVGRVLGSYQADELKSHSHSMDLYRSNGSADGSSKAGAYTDLVGRGSSTTSSEGGGETRPRNVAVNYIIKY
ncbi:MAG: phage tail protein [Gammaproteobacteria bacterium]|nr:phage tail protein [Gammaproteobacteria bacterium]